MGFNKNVGLMLGTHEAHAKLAEAWFTFLGFIGATTVFHVAAQKTGAIPLVALKWVCYFLLFSWVYYKICQLIWFIYPSADIVNGKPTKLVIGLSVWLSSMTMIGVYKISFMLFEIFISAAGYYPGIQIPRQSFHAGGVNNRRVVEQRTNALRHTL